MQSGSRDEVNDDVISLGEGDDALSWSGSPGTGSIDGGSGVDAAELFHAARTTWVIDLVAEVISAGERQQSNHGFEQWDVSSVRFDSMTFRGGPAAETLRSTRFAGGVLDARMGAGDDLLATRRSGAVSGGAGDDELSLYGQQSQDGEIKLAAGTAIIGRAASVTFPVGSWETVRTLGFGAVSATGTSGPDRLFVIWACQADVRALGGDDRVVFSRTSSPRGCSKAVVDGQQPGTLWAQGGSGHDVITGSTAGDVLRGGRGRDVLIGLGGGDVLIGQQGRDTARGGPGRDTCRTELRRGCEKR